MKGIVATGEYIAGKDAFDGGAVVDTDDEEVAVDDADNEAVGLVADEAAESVVGVVAVVAAVAAVVEVTAGQAEVAAAAAVVAGEDAIWMPWRKNLFLLVFQRQELAWEQQGMGQAPEQVVLVKVELRHRRSWP
jgi:hypothetical protein